MKKHGRYHGPIDASGGAPVALGLALLGLCMAACGRYRLSTDSYVRRETLEPAAAEIAEADRFPASPPAPPAGATPRPGPDPAPTGARPTGTLPADRDGATPAGAGPPRVDPAILSEGAAFEVGRAFEPVYFEADSYELGFITRRTLLDYSRWLAENPTVSITLEGYCDLPAATEFGANVSMARTAAVRDRLVGLGIMPERLFTIAFGEERPVVTGPRPEERGLNRRVEFLAYVAPKGGFAPPAPGPTAPAQPLAPPEPPHSEEIL